MKYLDLNVILNKINVDSKIVYKKIIIKQNVREKFILNLFFL